MDDREAAVAANNQVWELLGRDPRSEADVRDMVHAAHASAWHWLRCGTPANEQRAEWLISHVYAVVGRAEPAVAHARRCIEITEAEQLKDFDLAYAYEAMARALRVADDPSAADWYERAANAGAAISDPEDREIFEGDLDA